MIAIGTAIAGRGPHSDEPGENDASPVVFGPSIEQVESRPSWWSLPWRIVSWMYRGFNSVNASDMAAAVAFNTMIALVPMLLLLVATAGLFLRNDTVLEQARLVIVRLVPLETADEAFTAALTARSNSGWFGLLSFAGLAWVGTGFVSCLARSMNRIYGARSSGYINEKQRGFLVLVLFSFFFLVASVASVVPTFVVGQDLPHAFERWLIADRQLQLLGYGIGFGTALLLFFTLYRVIPNAGQRFLDVWPGTVIGATLFFIVTQVFPLYIRIIGGGNRYGQVLGFFSLLVASVLILAHVILFGAYVNASWQRRRRLRRRRKLEGGSEGHSIHDAIDLMLEQ